MAKQNTVQGEAPVLKPRKYATVKLGNGKVAHLPTDSKAYKEIEKAEKAEAAKKAPTK